MHSPFCEPESIEGNTVQGAETSFNVINFRAGLGNELYEYRVDETGSAPGYGGVIGFFNIGTSYVVGGSHPVFYHTSSFNSIHPAITASAPFLITQSFIYEEATSPSSSIFTSSSVYRIIFEEDSPEVSYADKHTETYYLDQPVAGLKNRITDKIKVSENSNYQYVLSNQTSIQQTSTISESYIRDVNLLEVAFSPQNELNDDIIQSYGYFNLGDYIGDPRFISSSARTYPELDKLAQEHFKKYYKSYTIFDYVRLIRYFDNSLFKMIKDYVPARTSVSTGVVIKQHMLERNRQRPPQMSYEELDLTGSIEIGEIEGGPGGSVNKYNTSSFDQSYTQSISTPDGTLLTIHSSQEEFYDGEYSGSFIIATTQSLNPNNPYKTPLYASGSYNTFLHYTSGFTTLAIFNDSNTAPLPGEILFWHDTGSLI